MDLSTYFDPIDPGQFPVLSETQGQARLGNIIDLHTQAGGMPDYSEAHIALIGVADDRQAVGNEGCGNGPDAVRKFLYSLSVGPYDVKMVDLGNIRTGYSITDTYFALSPPWRN